VGPALGGGGDPAAPRLGSATENDILHLSFLTGVEEKDKSRKSFFANVC